MYSGRWVEKEGSLPWSFWELEHRGRGCANSFGLCSGALGYGFWRGWRYDLVHCVVGCVLYLRVFWSVRGSEGRLNVGVSGMETVFLSGVRLRQENACVYGLGNGFVRPLST